MWQSFLLVGRPLCHTMSEDQRAFLVSFCTETAVSRNFSSSRLSFSLSLYLLGSVSGITPRIIVDTLPVSGIILLIPCLYSCVFSPHSSLSKLFQPSLSGAVNLCPAPNLSLTNGSASDVFRVIDLIFTATLSLSLSLARLPVTPGMHCRIMLLNHSSIFLR